MEYNATISDLHRIDRSTTTRVCWLFKLRVCIIANALYRNSEGFASMNESGSPEWCIPKPTFRDPWWTYPINNYRSFSVQRDFPLDDHRFRRITWSKRRSALAPIHCNLGFRWTILVRLTFSSQVNITVGCWSHWLNIMRRLHPSVIVFAAGRVRLVPFRGWTMGSIYVRDSFLPTPHHCPVTAIFYGSNLHLPGSGSIICLSDTPTTVPRPRL